MAGICGWIGSSNEWQERDGVLDAMAAALGEQREGASHTLTERGSAIAIRIGIVPVEMHRSSGITAAVQGRPSWKGAEYAKLAAERGCAEALIELYRRLGADCLQYVTGPVAIAIVDAETSSGLLAVDRMGVRGMCYATVGGQLLFGSTTESVAAHPKVGRRISHQAIFDYLYCHVVPSPRTIFEGVHKLEPAQCVVFRNGNIEKRFYWELRYTDEGAPSESALEERFHVLLREATERAIANDRDVGSFLSGGTDSSTVAGMLSELRGKPAKTYSIGFAVDGFDEMGYARIASRHFQTAPHEYYVSPNDVVDAIPIIANAYDEPFGNDSAVPAYFCARMARADGIHVMLAGDGGDEIFGGNARYAKQRVFEVYQRLPASLRHAIIEPLGGMGSPDRGLPVLRKLRSYVKQASIPLPDRLETYNFLHRAALSEIFEPDFLASIDPSAPVELIREAYLRAPSRSYINRMMHLDLKQTLADNDLRKVSRMCEVAGVEARYPLLDEALVEFAAGLPARLKVRGLKLRYFFKRALRDFLPPEIIAKTKHGFGMPFGVWLRDHKPLADLVQASLASFERRGIVKPAYLTALSHQHESAHAGYYGIMIWVIMMLEQWMESRRA